MNRTTRATLAAFAGAVAGLAPAIAWAGAPAAAPPTGPIVVTVTNSGDPATAVDLTPVATVGTTALSDSTEAVIGEWSGPGSTERYDVSGTSSDRSTVIAANPDGSATLTAVLDSSTATDNTGGSADVFTDDQANLVGVPVDVDYDRYGASTAMRPSANAAVTPEQAESIAAYVEIGATGPIVAPAEPVGLGATWEATPAYADVSLDLPLDYSYRLTSVDGDRVTIEFTWSANVSSVSIRPSAADEYAGYSVSATVTGTGTMTGAITGIENTLTTHGRYRFVYAAGGSEVVDEFDHWTETNTHPA